MKDEFYNWFICIVLKLKRLTDQELVHLHVDEGGEYISYALLH